jgi:hypothetical protein
MILNEEKFLQELGVYVENMNIPKPEDKRLKLHRNENGYKWQERSVEDLEGLVFHQALGNYSLSGIAKYHTSEGNHLWPTGLESISYTWAIEKDGMICLCNDFSKKVWSQGDMKKIGDENAKYMSVMFTGLFKAEGMEKKGAIDPTPQQRVSAVLLWELCKANWNWDNSALYGHYHFGKKHCPGDMLKELIEAIRPKVK